MSNDQTISSRLPLLTILTVLIGLVVYLQWPASEQQRKSYKRIVSVKNATVAMAEFVDSVEGVGTARANEKVLITSKYSDLVEEVFFQDGQIVKRGDVLVRLNNQEELAKVKEYEANLSESVAQLNRLTELLTTKATSKSIVDQQEAKTKAISAQLSSARTRLEELTIKAPFSGMLGFREISRGAYINSGSVITSLDDVSTIKVDFTLPERLLTKVHVGQKISATNSAYKDKKFIGEISSIDSRIDASTRSIKVRAKLPNDNLNLRPGMMLNIQVVLLVEELLQLPESTIIPIEDKHYVFVIEDDLATRKEVTIGRRQAGIVEVLSGVKQGEQVVVEGALKLRDGANVKVLEVDGVEVKAPEQSEGSEA
ncbi:efflux RND transporter periplasmic adaptor subunit [Colwellia sp. RSH04]|uniref:efflux RND transporter periplasmic adaptor subunit n=1 Tax=Colwellia sp. RSH04 TaxID=2305464 RepID=UPI000E56788D|nr:efflux RND transporter periplasmic adaptor subunit [Colwellia sp. RSH04]RHW77441.1 efflux RND transporter periplasmic adaptor subunit [Colwellia sp. RSH04]